MGRGHSHEIVDGKKWCFLCKQMVDVSLFATHKGRRSGLQPACRPCFKAKYGFTRSRVKSRYNLEERDYNAMLEVQHGRCAICKQLPGPKRLSVDHDHRTGAIRSLLCIACNVGLGMFGDSAEVLDAASMYLRLHNHAT